MDPAIRVEGVSKRYWLGSGQRPDSFSERLEQLVRAPARWVGRGRRQVQREEFWALRDVSLEVQPGEIVGLIGRNGAGKSTLLKLLSEITRPTMGRIRMRGRVATLLEVGTGFHPELTGRENVYLNGAILGLRRREIDGIFDEIVEFADIGPFLDTPVKRYSSGMFVRLAFAVAAHLESEILIVDEVLAVGDTAFQKKCLGKMTDSAEAGRTVVFVSHNLDSVQRLCGRAYLFESGRVRMNGDPEEVIAHYLSALIPEQVDGVSIIPEEVDRSGTGEAKLRSVVMKDMEGHPITEVLYGQPFQVTATVEVFETLRDISFELGLLTMEEQQVAIMHSTDDERPPVSLSPGMRQVTVHVPVTLLPHEFILNVGIHRTDGRTVDHVHRAHRFTALNVPESGTDHYPWSIVRGYVRPDTTWSDVVPASGPARVPARTTGEPEP